MENYMFRQFLYLDTTLIDDWIDVLEPTRDEKIVEKNQVTGALSGGVDAKVISGSGKRETTDSTEVTRQSSHTYAAKFQRLHRHFDAREDGFYFESIDEVHWSGIVRQTMLEVAGELTLSHFSTALTFAEAMENLNSSYEARNGSPMITPEMKLQIETLRYVVKKLDLPITLSLLRTPEYKFVAYLRPQMLRTEQEHLAGEVMMFCKVSRVLEPGEKLPLFDPAKAMGVLENQPLDITNYVALPSSSTVESPAAIVIPVAIYR